MALAQNIIETAVKHSGGAKVKKIALTIGGASGVAGESIKMYFDIIAADTKCRDAVIEIENVAPMLECRSCGVFFKRRPFSFSCECGGDGRPTDIGTEFYVKHIEVENE